MYGHTSQFSMGNDVADINNDDLQTYLHLICYRKIITAKNYCLHQITYDKFKRECAAVFLLSIMRNMLQLNNGNSSFSEIGQIEGISNTDWKLVCTLARL